MEDYYKLIDEVVSHNSSEKSTICCIEEMSELTKVLTKKMRKSPKFNINDLTEELAHVLLMCGAIAKEHGIKEEDILDVQHHAVDRMLDEK